jgi:class 3 adenylate cyclase/dihydrofolate reductase
VLDAPRRSPIRRLIASEFVTLDGVMEAPGHETHPDGKNQWALRHATEDMQRFKIAELEQAGCIILGRVTYQIFAAFWPTAPKDEGFADRMNAIAKYVVTKTLKRLEWENSHVLDGDVAEGVRTLKEQPGDGDLLLLGSADVLDALLDHDLVDELRLEVYPVVLGSGKRLFRNRNAIEHMQLRDLRTFESGVVLLSYESVREAPTSSYVERFAWSKEVMRSFEAAQNTDRVLATVLFSDIVDSTGQAAALGDREWRRLLDRHDRAAQTEVERLHGRVVKTTGDGLLATFDAPTRALRCAFNLIDVVAELGLRIRVAIHTGEVEIRDEDVGGIGVHIASRALGQAGDGRVVVTRTVRELATGTDLRFEPLGAVALRGVPGEWELFQTSIA